jgi:hypothetical protein
MALVALGSTGHHGMGDSPSCGLEYTPGKMDSTSINIRSAPYTGKTNRWYLVKIRESKISGCATEARLPAIRGAKASGAATDSAPACMLLRGWTGCRCAASQTGACASRRSGNGRACEHSCGAWVRWVHLKGQWRESLRARKAFDLPKLFLRLLTKFHTSDFPMTLAK